MSMVLSLEFPENDSFEISDKMYQQRISVVFSEIMKSHRDHCLDPVSADLFHS